MKRILLLLAILSICSCTHLNAAERRQKMELRARGITVDHPGDNWEKPANGGAAGALNLLPGVGNFYLAAGNGGDSAHWLYGTLNLLTWPISILWGIPEAAIDANVINERELIYHYYYEINMSNSFQSRRYTNRQRYNREQYRYDE